MENELNNAFSGYLAVLLAMIFWGSYTVPLKKYQNLSPVFFQVFLSVGIFVSSLLFAVVRQNFFLTLWGVLDGFYWTLGAGLSFWAVQKEGLAGASSRWMGTAILTSFVTGLVGLQEQVQLLPACGGLVLLLIGLLLASRPESLQKQVQHARHFPWRSVLAGLVFGTYFLPLHWSGVHALDFVLSMGVGVLCGGLLMGMIVRPAWRTGSVLWVSMGCGIAWNIANVAGLVAISILGLAVGFPLTQLALLVSLFWGIAVFGEFSLFQDRMRIVIAAIFTLIGALLLGLAKGPF